MKLTPIICKALFAVLLVSGCDTRIAPSTTQQLSIRSGDFGIVDEAVIISIDFIRFDRPRTRYAESISELALDWLNRAARDVPVWMCLPRRQTVSPFLAIILAQSQGVRTVDLMTCATPIVGFCAGRRSCGWHEESVSGGSIAHYKKLLSSVRSFCDAE